MLRPEEDDKVPALSSSRTQRKLRSGIGGARSRDVQLN